MKYNWHDHGPDSEMPCDGNSVVIIQQRNGAFDKATAKEFGWLHRVDKDGKKWGGDILKWCLISEE